MNEAVFYYCIGTKEKRIKLFLEQVLKREIIKVEIKNVKLLKDYINSKEKIIDYLVLTDIGYINVEINNNEESWIMERNISYACKIVTNSIKKGKLEIVKNMLKENFEISLISKVTGLSEKQIKSLI